MSQNEFSTVFLVLVFSFRIMSFCPKGYFKFDSMLYCYPWLTCEDLDSINVKELIGFGSTKAVYLAEWKNCNISYSVLSNEKFKQDFFSGLYILKSLPQNSYVVQLLGFCERKNVIITEYHKYNNALNFMSMENSLKLSLKDKISLCLSYVKILSYLHYSPLGTRVNCDSNDLNKLLSQVLITNKLKLVLSDVDALPEVEMNSSIKCGSRPIVSKLAAPEQIWQGPNKFSYHSMPGYDHKTDIWKVPEVCNYFLNGPDLEIYQFYLFGIHKKCKDPDPQKRPTSRELVNEYKQILLNL